MGGSGTKDPGPNPWGLAGLRRRGGVVLGAPWLRAPLLLLRYPGLLVAVGTAVLILAVAGAASPLFLSSAGNATLQRGIAETCRWEVGVKAGKNAPIAGFAFSRGFGPSGPRQSAMSVVQETDGYLRTRMGKGLSHVAPVEADISSTITVATKTGASGNDSSRVRLYTRDGGLDHVAKLTSAGGAGVWVTDTLAKELNIEPGDSITFTGSLANSNKKAKAPVAGVYRDLLNQPPAPYWCAQYHLIYPLSAFENSNPPSLVMTDRATFLRLAKKLGERDATFTYDLPVRPAGLTVGEARELAGGLRALLSSLGAANPFGGQSGGFSGAARRSSTLPTLVDRADQTVLSLRRSVDTISLAGRFVALAVIAASGIYWVSRRRAEVALLSSRGIGAIGIGTKVLLETVPVAAAAAVGGWALGVWLAKLLGPTDLLDPGVPAAALRQDIWTVGIGVLFLSLVAALSARRETEGTPTRGTEALSRAPWELVALALAGASLYEILSRGTRPVQSGGGPAKLDVLVLLFPILFVAGASGLAVRVVARALPALRAAGKRRSHATFLASRRVAAAPRMALALITATALAIGILVYAGALTRSVAATSDAKARVFTGSDVSVIVAEDISVPASLRGNTTKVSVIDTGYLLPDQDSLGVLGVDRTTFGAAAFWDRSFSGKPLDQLLKDLTPPSDPAAPVPVLVAGGGLPSTGTLVFRGGPARIPVKVVDVVEAFPGMDPSRPFLVADEGALDSRGAPGFSAIWSKADGETVRSALPRGVHILSFVTAAGVQQDPSFLSLSWALGFLQALGIMTGLIVLGGMLLYLEARQRAREVSYALAKRMGLTAGTHRRSVAMELATMLGLGAVLGALLAWVAARLVYGRIDALPQIPPPPLFRTPVAVLALTAVALVLSAWVGAWRVQRTTERARVAEVMRIAG
jgi:putative ABC transport system permease protein